MTTRRLCGRSAGPGHLGDLDVVYEGWRYPDDWRVEGFFVEGPKLVQREGAITSRVHAEAADQTVRLAIVNDRHEGEVHLRERDGWKRLDAALDVAGYNHNVFGRFLSLRDGDRDVLYVSIRIGRRDMMGEERMGYRIGIIGIVGEELERDRSGTLGRPSRLPRRTARVGWSSSRTA